MKIEEIFLKLPEINDLIKRVKQSTGENFLLTGVQPAIKPLLLQTYLQQLKKPILIVEDTLNHAQGLVDELIALLGPNQVNFFPVEETMAAEAAIASPEFRAARIQTLAGMQVPKITVTAASGIGYPLLPPVQWREQIRQLKPGMNLDLNKFIAFLNSVGYQRQQLVAKKGEFAVRGSIVDIYPFDQLNPIRIDLFDTEIDSIREFSASNQRSLQNLDCITVLPASEYPLDAAQQAHALAVLKKQYQKVSTSAVQKEFRENLNNINYKLTAALTARQFPAWAAAFKRGLLAEKNSLLDYLPDKGVVFWDDLPRIVESQRLQQQEQMAWETNQLASGKLFEASQPTTTIKEWQKKDQHNSIFLALFRKGMGKLTFSSIADIQVRMIQQFFGQMPLLKTEMQRWEKQQQTVIFAINNPDRIRKVQQTLIDFAIPVEINTTKKLNLGQPQLVQIGFNHGFELPQLKLVVVTESELFQKVKAKQPRRLTMENTERLKSYTDLKKGDYVVHVNHGIGRFLGIKTISDRGKHQDYLTIEYQDAGKLFVPVKQIDRIQKYVSAEGKSPHLNKLGGSDWEKTKRRVAAKVEDIADELVELYAKRETEKGFAYSLDDEFQHEFEAAFAYTETPDQLRSAREIKHDMQQSKPMDRLLIGDVGYGKTEVALRAAFKAIQDGKQVAFLVPTTVLAQQHYETMLSRFEGFPVEIGILSRFRTQQQVKQTLKKLAVGQLDIVVGTHRLLSKDVKFKDLGLLIVDEEQRFGVKHKEKIKELRSSIDVLTLTATPIPRTLNMSMLGVRDLSVIETAPLNRFPIQTYVIEQDYSLIADAVHREINRGGQTFYLHNRVADIERTVTELKTMIPEARIGYIHGQMSEAQLERILLDFINGEFDVLVTTTIIETGIDIPNVNTLIVEDADKMGLAQLYQLRGRVGRSNRMAYAYFMYRPDKVLTEISEKRLEAIKDFTELGSGFKIAMRDLAIRGAGNLLGRQQHGFIDSVGYDLYVQMLKDAVAKKQGKQVRLVSDAEIDLDLEAYLPSEYIADPRQKIEIYKRIRQLQNQAQFDEVQADLLDRFGDYPSSVANLLEIGRLKMLADQIQVKSIQQVDRKFIIIFAKQFANYLTARDLLEALAQTTLKATIKNESGCFNLILNQQPKSELLEVITQFEKLFAFLADSENQRSKGKKNETKTKQ
ncbi:transcription-repair coupling factor [Liquorilactobacillus nagelii]|uniref:transcription-repair coupling factor n=1 Tax=Liquorilactobacillus nagelii TaxID=82688 RepID=UPI0039E7F93B